MNPKILRMGISLCIICMMIGCTSKGGRINTSYDFTAMANGVTKYQDKYEVDGIRITHSLSLLQFYPQGDAFLRYVNKYDKTEGDRHILISKETRIVDANGRSIQPEKIEKGSKVNFTVYLIEDNYFLVASEIKIADVE
ncbi:hypothetical protein [Paenibacillus hexagrammi]|uniref:DUF3221 domain-containing protein n=1 Tax=Paenibacillus hexagrammi TaxID=2908839 RepID=A0ABY3SEA5_9BACL|nr:hypothetical protein [Paenibacillus sp. YPD9-1]UJF32246.1 hypothetical protein L0M14_21360 [Paenibacillus sp. YPD9-1]